MVLGDTKCESDDPYRLNQGWSNWGPGPQGATRECNAVCGKAE